MELNFKLTRSKVLVIVIGFLLAGIVTAHNYGTAYAYSTADVADFNATTVSYYQNLTIWAIVPPMAFKNFGIKTTPENQIAGQRIQVHLIVDYAMQPDAIIKTSSSSSDLVQPPNHQQLDYIEANSIQDLMSNKSEIVYLQDD
jgi:hypothetical protein